MPDVVISPQFQQLYDSTCGGDGAASSPACVDFIYRALNESGSLTNYLDSLSTLLESQSEQAFSDWNFIVQEFNKLDPQVVQFVNSGNKTMSALVKEQAANVTSFNLTSIQPSLNTSLAKYAELVDANTYDFGNLTQQVDSAGKLVFQNAVAASGIEPMGQPNLVVNNVSGYLNQFWETEFSRIKGSSYAQQNALLNQLENMERDMNATEDLVGSRISNLSSNTNSTALLLQSIAPQRIASTVANVTQSLKNLIYTNFNQSGNISQVLSDSVSKYNSLVNGTLFNILQAYNASIDSLGDDIDQQINETITNQSALGNSLLSQFNQSNLEFLHQVELYSQMLNGSSSSASVGSVPTNSTSVDPYIVTDTDLGVNSIQSFNALDQSVTQQIGSAIDLIAPATQDALNQLSMNASSLSSLTDPQLNSLVANSSTAMSDYANSIINDRLDDVESNVTAMVNGIVNAVLQSSTVGNATTTMARLTPQITMTMNSNISDLANRPGVNAVSDIIATRQQEIFDEVSAGLGSILLGFNSTVNSTAVEALFDEYANPQLNAIVAAANTALDDQAAAEQNALNNLTLRYVETPANNISAANLVQQSLSKDLLFQIDQINRNIASGSSLLASAKAQLESARVSIANGIDSQTQSVIDQISNQVSLANSQLSSYQRNFVGNLPANAGIVTTITALISKIQDLEAFIKSKSNAITNLMNDNGFSVGKQTDAVAQTQIAFNSAKQVVNDIANISPIDYAGLINSGLSSLSTVLDPTKELTTVEKSVGDAVAQINTQIGSKQIAMAQTLQSEQQQDSDRSALLSSIGNQFVALNQTAAVAYNDVAGKVNNFAGSVDGILEDLSNQVDALINDTAVEKVNASEYLASSVAAVADQVANGAPTYLSQFEAEKANQLSNSLSEIKGELGKISDEATGQFVGTGTDVAGASVGGSAPVGDVSAGNSFGSPGSSFLHGVFGKASVGLTQITQSLGVMRSEDQRLMQKIRLIGNSVNTTIVEMLRDKSVFPSLTSGVADVGWETPVMDRPMKALNETVDRWNNQTGERVDEWVTAGNNTVGAMIAAAGNRTNVTMARVNKLLEDENTHVRPSIESVTATAADLHAVIDTMTNLTKTFNQSTVYASVTGDLAMESSIDNSKSSTKDKINSTAVSSAHQQLDQAIQWFRSFVGGLSASVDQKVADGFASLNATIEGIGAVQQHLRDLSDREDRIEAKFNSTVVERLKRETQEADRKVGDRIEKMRRMVVGTEDGGEGLMTMERRDRKHVLNSLRG